MQNEATLRLTTQGLIALILVGTVRIALAGGEAIGFAVATGSYHVDSAQVYGNTTRYSERDGLDRESVIAVGAHEQRPEKLWEKIRKPGF